MEGEGGEKQKGAGAVLDFHKPSDGLHGLHEEAHDGVAAARQAVVQPFQRALHDKGLLPLLQGLSPEEEEFHC